MPATRDPVSELFDDAARRLLDRAYASPGTWQGTRLADPQPKHLTWLASRGIDPFGKDTAAGGRAKTRWARAFVRSVYYQHKWWSAGGGQGWRGDKRTVARNSGGLVVEVGNVVIAKGIIPRGRAVRVKLERGGQAKERAVEKIPQDRIWRDHGPAWADPNRRDW